jgi:RNA recognition motif-containing protein
LRKPSRSYTPQHPSVIIQLCRRASPAPNRPSGWSLSFFVKEAITGASCPKKRRLVLGKKLYVGNLGYSVSSSDLEKLFSAFGTVSSAQVI